MKNRRKAVQPFEIKKRKIDIFKNYEANGVEKIQRKLEIFSTLISKKSTYLINVLENAVYDRFEINDGKEKHKGLAGLDVYVSALRIGDRLYSVKIKVDIPGKGEIEQRKTKNGVIEDGRYKDHKVSEIDITPCLLYTSDAADE